MSHRLPAFVRRLQRWTSLFLVQSMLFHLLMPMLSLWPVEVAQAAKPTHWSMDQVPGGNRGHLRCDQKGKVGNYCYFNGKSYADAGADPRLRFNRGQSFSMGGWIYVDNGATRRPVLDAYRYGLEVGKDSKVSFWMNDGGWSSVKWNQPLKPAHWYHVLGVYNGGKHQIELFVDGKSVGKKTTKGPSNYRLSNFYVGRTEHMGGHYFRGGMDDMKVWRAALTTQQVQKEYNWEEENQNQDQDQENDSRDDTAPVKLPRLSWSMDEVPEGAHNLNCSHEGKIGKACKFHPGQYIETSTEKLPKGNSPMSVTFWAKPNREMTDAYFFFYGEKGEGRTFAPRIYRSKNLSFMGYAADLNTKYRVPINTWHHYSFVYDGTTMVIYADGKKVGAKHLKKGLNLGTDRSLIIGGRNIKGPVERAFFGLMDDMRVYDSALSQGEVRDVMTGKLPAERPPEKEPSPAEPPEEAPTTAPQTVEAVGHWSFDEFPQGAKGNLRCGQEGKIGKSCYFDGKSLVDVGGDPALRFGPGQSFSLGSWVYLDEGLSRKPILDILRYGIQVIDKGKFMFWIFDGGWDSNIVWEEPLEAHRWYHIIGAYDGKSRQMELFIDGKSVGKKATNGLKTYNLSGFQIGKTNHGRGYHFQGRIDEAKVWNVALNADQAQAEYNLASPLVEEPEIPDPVVVTPVPKPNLPEPKRSWTGEDIEGKKFVEASHLGALKHGTVRTRVKAKSLDGAVFTFGKGHNGRHDSGYLYLWKERFFFGLWAACGSGGYNAEWKSPPKIGEWIDITTTWGKGGINLYVNGEKRAHNKCSAGMPHYNKLMIKGTSWNKRFFDGEVEYLEVYDQVLNEEQIKSVYDYEQAPPVAKEPVPEPPVEPVPDPLEPGDHYTVAYQEPEVRVRPGHQGPFEDEQAGNLFFPAQAQPASGQLHCGSDKDLENDFGITDPGGGGGGGEDPGGPGDSDDPDEEEEEEPGQNDQAIFQGIKNDVDTARTYLDLARENKNAGDNLLSGLKDKIKNARQDVNHNNVNKRNQAREKYKKAITDFDAGRRKLQSSRELYNNAIALLNTIPQRIADLLATNTTPNLGLRQFHDGKHTTVRQESKTLLDNTDQILSGKVVNIQEQINKTSDFPDKPTPATVSIKAATGLVPKNVSANAFPSQTDAPLVRLDDLSLEKISASASSTTSGYSAGDFQVNERGAGMYQMKITVPPGTAGMEPDLALSYSSQGSDGMMGLGWSLSGVSAITRCPATVAQDGFSDPVDFDSNDRFCLDGQRLVAVKGSYGADGTEYRTEQDTFQKVVSYGRAGNGPERFKVWTKSGLVQEYAFTQDARIEARHCSAKGDVSAWAVNKVSDTLGNAMTFTYEEDGQNGMFYPLQIDYTQNKDAGLTPYASVRFSYENRPDIAVGSAYGSNVRLTKRLHQVATYYGNKQARRYQLRYQNGGLVNASHLVEIKECGSSGSCFAPTTFGWQALESGKTQLDFTSKHDRPVSGGGGKRDVNIARVKYGDFNGDGRMDIYQVRGFSDSNTWDKIYLADEHGRYSDSRTINGLKSEIPGDPEKASWAIARIQLGDFNGDGRTDIYKIRGWDEAKHGIIAFAQKDGTFVTKETNVKWNINGTIQKALIDVSRAKLADFNGDGRTDIYVVKGWGNTKTDKVYLSRGEGSFDEVDGIDSFVNDNVLKSGLSMARLQLGDFNGDGKVDIYQIKGDGSKEQDTIHLSQGDGTYEQINGLKTFIGQTGGKVDKNQIPSIQSGAFSGAKEKSPEAIALDMARLKFGDFNGDGRTDIYTVRGFGTDKVADRIHLSRGDGSYQVIAGLETKVMKTMDGAPVDIARVKVGDFNGDGKSDIYHVRGYGNQEKEDVVFLSQGNGLYTKINGISSKVENDNQKALKDINGIQLADFNGDGRMDIARFENKNLWHMFLQTEIPPDLMTRVTNGHGGNLAITYQAITEPEVHTQDQDSRYPAMDFQGSLYVVTNYRGSNGIGGTNSFDYDYAGAKLDLRGRGFLGFRKVTLTDNTTGSVTESTYSQDPSFVGMKTSESQTVNGKLVTRTDQVLDKAAVHQGVWFPYVRSSQTEQYEINSGKRYKFTKNTQAYSQDYGNLIHSTVDHGDGHITTTVNVYSDDVSRWHLGRLVRSEETRTKGPHGLTRTSAFEYDRGTGLLTKEIIEPNQADLRLEKTYQYNGFGNITKSTTTARDGSILGIGTNSSRSVTTSYDRRGRFVHKTTNDLGHTEVKHYDPRTGVVIYSRDPNGLETEASYDGFGRKITEKLPDYRETAIVYGRCSSSTCPSRAEHYVRTQTTGSGSSVVYFDLLDREVRQESVSLEGKKIFVDTQYDQRGLVSKKSEPYFAGETPQQTVYTHDPVGRAVKVLAPGNRVTTSKYNGLETSVTNAKGQVHTRQVDARGQLLNSFDAEGNVLSYGYDPFGNPVVIADTLGNATSIEYDLRGRKTSLRDPDTGVTRYQYNGFGEQVLQTDAKGQKVDTEYDKLGRMVKRTEAEGVSRWEYDTAPNGVGKLAKITGPDGYEERYEYDALGRLKHTTRVIGGQEYRSSQTYDQLGRVASVYYPTGFAVKHVYSQSGHLREVRRLADSQLLWQAERTNARGQLQEQLLGNGLRTNISYNPQTGFMTGIQTRGQGANDVQHLAFEFDALGNLITRRDNGRNLAEHFEYDSLNRLVRTQVTGGAVTALVYDKAGNILERSDVGKYTYGNGAGPHAVTSISGGPGENQYTYDANGNRLTSKNGTVAYSSFNKPIRIVEGATEMTFRYNPNYDRYQQVVRSGDQTTTKYYLGKLYEKETTGDQITHVHHIMGSSGGVAVFSYQEDGPGKTRYLHKDHLGSIQAITDEKGALTETLSYDAWGARRDPNTWEATRSIQRTESEVDRGFTGHEQLDDVSLIHMNGRVYDPAIGRFLSADPFVQAPENLQSFNRYSYVVNNPLSYNDPSGYFFKSLFSAIGVAIAGVLTAGIALAAVAATSLTAIAGGATSAIVLTSVGKATALLGFGFGSAFAGTLVNGGSIGSAFKAGIISAGISAVSAGASAGVGSVLGEVGNSLLQEATRAAVHGSVQGGLSKLQGGKFIHGFAAGGVSSGLGSSFHAQGWYKNLGLGKQTAIQSMIGGTASKVGGGKFVNGASSGAAIHVFNHAGEHEGLTQALTQLGIAFDFAKVGGASLGAITSGVNTAIYAAEGNGPEMMTEATIGAASFAGGAVVGGAVASTGVGIPVSAVAATATSRVVSVLGNYVFRSQIRSFFASGHGSAMRSSFRSPLVTPWQGEVYGPPYMGSFSTMNVNLYK